MVKRPYFGTTNPFSKKPTTLWPVGLPQRKTFDYFLAIFWFIKGPNLENWEKFKRTVSQYYQAHVT